MTRLVLENKNETDNHNLGAIAFTPMVGPDYWAFRVQLSPAQAILGFPKFGTCGIGFAREHDWNTNLPYWVPAKEIWEHIAHNKGDDEISDEACLTAIVLIQAAARAEGAYAYPPKAAGAFWNITREGAN